MRGSIFRESVLTDASPVDNQSGQAMSQFVMQRSITVLSSFCFVLVMISCAGTSGGVRSSKLLNERLTIVEGAHARFPESDWIVGVGDSSDGSQAAELAARAQVSTQIESSIESEFKSMDRVAIRYDGKAKSSVGTSEVLIDSRTTTSFIHAEQIRAVPEMTACRDGFCVAVAVLNRRAAFQALESDYNRVAIDFRNAADGAIRKAASPASSGSIAGSVTAGAMAEFATSYNASRTYFGNLANINAQATVIRDGINAFAPDMNKFGQVLAAGHSLLADFPVRLRPPTSSEAQILADRVMKALDLLGVNVTLDQGCDSGLKIELDSGLKCEQGRILRMICEADIAVSLFSCPDGKMVGRFALDVPDSVGVSVRDEDDARRQILDAMQPEAIAGALRAGLSNYLPMK